MAPFEILFQDDSFIAIHKPPGIHVHATELSPREPNCMQLLRDQIDQWVYPAHRLDRAVSGVLLFTLSKDTARHVGKLFESQQVEKEYIAVVRGYLDDRGEIIHALREHKEKPAVNAQTNYELIQRVELPHPVGKFQSGRFSVAKIFPRTGRQNQIRKHMVHISHPIIGDVRFGDGRQNQYFREHLDCRRLLLASTALSFEHPVTGEATIIRCAPTGQFARVLNRLDVGGA